MALPKLDSPTYETELPSTGEKIKYRPFLVKEQKLLLMSQESKDPKEQMNSMGQIISACTFNKVDPFTSPLFDIEYLLRPGISQPKNSLLLFIFIIDKTSS